MLHTSLDVQNQIPTFTSCFPSQQQWLSIPGSKFRVFEYNYIFVVPVPRALQKLDELLVNQSAGTVQSVVIRSKKNYCENIGT